MKNMKRLLAAMLLAGLMFSLAACTGGNSKVPPATGAVAFPLKDQISVSMWIEFNKALYPDYDSLADHPFWKRLEEKTNIKLDFYHPANLELVAQLGEYNAAIASGTLQDIVHHTNYSYNGGTDAAVTDEVYMRINEKIDICMPNFKGLMDENAQIGKSITSLGGNIAHLPSINGLTGEALPIVNGPLIRKDMLDEYQLEVPSTIEQWEQTLRSLKVSGGIEHPLHMNDVTFGPFFSGMAFASAYGATTSQILDTDMQTVIYPILTDGMREYLTKMSEWYSHGYLFVPEKTADKAIYSTDQVGAFCGTIDDITAMKAGASNPNYELVGVPYPVLKEGDQLEFGASSPTISPLHFDSISIRTTNRYPNESLAMFDLMYTEEMYMQASWGIKEEDYTMVDGKPAFTEKISKGNPGNLSAVGAVNAYTYPALYRDPFAKYSVYNESQKAAMETWGKFDLTKRSLPFNLPRTRDELAASDQKGGDVLFTGASWYLKFITGETSMAQWDDYVDDMYARGYEDIIGLTQMALDRYKTS